MNFHPYDAVNTTSSSSMNNAATRKNRENRQPMVEVEASKRQKHRRSGLSRQGLLRYVKVLEIENFEQARQISDLEADLRAAAARERFLEHKLAGMSPATDRADSR